jgi:GH43 family beta-xylosidase
MDGRCFPILHSTDLIRWTEHGSAMDALANDHVEYWAPEVTFWNGTFYLYYSSGDGVSMQLRVAESKQPSGPFTDSGRSLSPPGFAIDPHVFKDEDGRRWMFYATDFLEHTHIGTGTVCDRLLDPYSLAGSPLPVTRGRFDWHVFDPERMEKGGVRWYTIEGPCVLKHKGLYYEMFSAGNWKNMTYGVGYAYSDNIERNQEWTQVCDGNSIFPVMQTVPDLAIGPGHNSVVRGPDNSQLYCIYHRWDASQVARLMAVDRLEFVGKQLVIYGPSTTPEHRPTPPRVRWDSILIPHHFTETETGDQTGWSETRIPVSVGSGILLEVWVRSVQGLGTYGICIYDDSSSRLEVRINPSGHFEIFQDVGTTYPDLKHTREALPPEFRADVHHLIHIEISGRLLRAVIDGGRELKCVLPGAPIHAALFTNEASAKFEGLSYTCGWTDNFCDDGVSLGDLGWVGGLSAWSIGKMNLRRLPGTRDGVLYKPLPSSSYELVANVWLPEFASKTTYRFWPLATDTEDGPQIEIAEGASGYHVSVRGMNPENDSERMELLRDLTADHWEQFRFRVDENIFSVGCRSQMIYRGSVTKCATRIGFDASGDALVDMIRVVGLEGYPGESL